MKSLLRSYGRGLTALFVVAVLAWALVLILLPQLTMLERALVSPKRSLDSSLALTLRRDAATCINVLQGYLDPAPEAAPQTLAVPSPGGMAVPSMGGMAVPSMGGATATGALRPYILQCDRADTHKRLVSDPERTLYLDEVFSLPRLAVRETDPIPKQIETAAQLQTIGADLYTRLLAEEATRSPYTLANFGTLLAPRLIPIPEDRRAAEAASIENRLYTLVGARYQADGQIYERIGLTILLRTLAFAVAVTVLALFVCYPIAYRVALASRPEQVVWLMLGLIIPYAIVELMRIYAWTTIIDNQGVINSILIWLGAITEPIPFNRYPATVFAVIAYTYVLFMVFPMLNVMSTLDRNQIEAARDLGARTWRVHTRIVIPHAKPGIAVGCIATFMLAAGAFSVPRIISRGLQSEWFSQTIYNKFFESENSNAGAAYSLAYTFICFGIVAAFMYATRTRLKDFAQVNR